MAQFFANTDQPRFRHPGGAPAAEEFDCKLQIDKCKLQIVKRHAFIFQFAIGSVSATKKLQGRRPAFTLLEVVLAIALSATLVALITSALSLFLTRTNDGRQRVEQAQLARNLMRLVGDDLRNVAIYSPQDTSIAAQLAQAAGSFDVDQISSGGSGGGSGSGSGTSGGAGVGTGGGAGSGGSSGGSSSSGSQTSGGDTTSQYQQPLGVYGNLTELQIDILQPARPMPTPPGAGPMASQDELIGPLWRGGLRTIRYYCRDGDRPRSDVIVSERFSSTDSSVYGGLVREDIDRLQFDFAQQLGSANSFAELGQVLAPEVLAIEFRYSDGTQILDAWNSEQQGTLPVAIEVRMWLQNPSVAGSNANANANANAEAPTETNLAEATQYVMTIPIWRSALASGSSSGLNSGSSSSSSGSGSTSGSGASSSGGSGAGSSSGSSSSF